MGKAILVGVLSLIALGLAAACGGNGEGETTPQAPGGQAPGPVEVKAIDFDFQPRELSGESGKALTVRVKNDGRVPHTFTINELNVDQVLQPGQEATVTFTPRQGGTFTFFCRFHPQQLRGSLQIAGSGGASPGGTTPAPGGGTPAGSPLY